MNFQNASMPALLLVTLVFSYFITQDAGTIEKHAAFFCMKSIAEKVHAQVAMEKSFHCSCISHLALSRHTVALCTAEENIPSVVRNSFSPFLSCLCFFSSCRDTLVTEAVCSTRQQHTHVYFDNKMHFSVLHYTDLV